MKANKKQIVFVVNPISGTSSKKMFDSIVEKTLDRAVCDWRIVRTERAGHAAEIASQCVAEGVDVCVAVGGDGTVNEVARSLVDSDTALGIVPCGSGNGLARHLCLPMSVKKAVRLIGQFQIDNFDYGLINDHPFFCTCGMGFDAFVSLRFSQSGSRGLVTYAKMVLSEGMRYKPDSYELIVEDQDGVTRHYEAFLVACANASQYGNNTYIAPEASMQDGLLDVIIVEPFKLLGGPKLLMDLFTRTVKSNHHVIHFKARKLHVHRSKEAAVHFDGDPMVMGTDIDIELKPAGLKAIVNPKLVEDKARPISFFNMLNKINSRKRTVTDY